jgi:hypothetical protein
MDGKRGFSMEINVVIQEFGFDCKIRKLLFWQQERFPRIQAAGVRYLCSIIKARLRWLVTDARQ